MPEKRRTLEVLSWDEIRPNVLSVNKELCEIIDQISPSKKHKMIKATYLYGDLILQDGNLFLPSPSGELVPMISDKIHKNIQNDLSYASIPLMLTLKNGNEVFIENNSRIIPLNSFHPGSLLGLFEALSIFETKNTSLSIKPFSRWSVSAGARSIFMLPKLSEKNAFKQLRKFYDIPATIFPKNMSDHWQVFKAIAQHHNFPSDWQNEIIFFPKVWGLDHKENNAWGNFKNYLFYKAWEQAQFFIGTIEQYLAWELYAEAIAIRNLKPTPYLADQVKHILSIAAGKSPGFRPADQSELVAPTKALQNAIVDIYQLKNYLSTIMHSCPLNFIDKSLPLYYSLNFPTVLGGSPFKKSSRTIMLDLRDIKQLIDTIKKFSKKNRMLSNGLIDNINFDYFHVENDVYGEIKSSKIIPTEDSSFLNDLKYFKEERQFCDTSLFWRGCLRIQKKNK